MFRRCPLLAVLLAAAPSDMGTTITEAVTFRNYLEPSKPRPQAPAPPAPEDEPLPLLPVGILAMRANQVAAMSRTLGAFNFKPGARNG